MFLFGADEMFLFGADEMFLFGSARLLINLLVIIGVVDTLHKERSVVDPRRLGVFDKCKNMRCIHRTFLHLLQIFALIYLAPIGAGMQVLLQN